MSQGRNVAHQPSLRVYYRPIWTRLAGLNQRLTTANEFSFYYATEWVARFCRRVLMLCVGACEDNLIMARVVREWVVYSAGLSAACSTSFQAEAEMQWRRLAVGNCDVLLMDGAWQCRQVLHWPSARVPPDTTSHALFPVLRTVPSVCLFDYFV